MHPTEERVVWDRTKLRADQRAKGWNDKQLAEQANVHQTTVSRFFKRGTISPANAQKLADALGQQLRRYVRIEDARDREDQLGLPLASGGSR